MDFKAWRLLEKEMGLASALQVMVSMLRAPCHFRSIALLCCHAAVLPRKPPDDLNVAFATHKRLQNF